jgi:hypothetical protein
MSSPTRVEVIEETTLVQLVGAGVVEVLTPAPVEVLTIGLQGPTGATGAQGPTGATGATGPQGPAGSGGAGAPTYSAENKDGVTIGLGAAVATHSSGTGVVRASAADSTRPCVGLATVGAAPTVAETVQTSGPLTVADWTAATGSATLTRGPYYLDPATPGLLTATAPTAAGQVVQGIGYAVSPNILELDIQPPILL